MTEQFLDATQESGTAFVTRNIAGEVVMLNLLRFREWADYSAHPDLAPDEPISGEAAYQKYIDHTLPFLQESGGEVLFMGQGGKYLIGPQTEEWDLVLLVRHKSVATFMAFAENGDYLATAGHRTAALADSRLLPIEEINESVG